MYSPKFHYTDKLVLNLIRIEQSKALLQNVDLNYNLKQKLSLNTKTEDIFYFARILKIDLDFKEASKVAAGLKLDDFQNDRNRIIMNYKNSLEFNRSTDSDNFSEFDTSVLLQHSRIILLQWRETWEANFRNFDDKIDETLDNYVQLRDKEIKGMHVNEAIEQIVEWYKYAIPSTAPIVRIAVAIYRLIEIAPFVAGNKFIILAILDYLLNKNGYGNKIYSSPTKLMFNLEERIQKNLTAAKLSQDISIWIEAFADAMSTQLIATREELNKFIAENEKSKSQPFLDLNKRQMKVLKYLQTVPSIKREDYCHMMDVSTMTAFRDLNELVRKKLLKIDGQGRGTKYRMATM